MIVHGVQDHIHQVLLYGLTNILVVAVITEVPGIGRKLLVPEISTEVRLRLFTMVMMIIMEVMDTGQSILSRAPEVI